MKRLLLTLLLLYVGYSASAQKIYVWCPENYQIKPRVGLRKDDTIMVAFFDGRTIPPKNKIECTTEQVIQALFLQLKSAYPSAILVLQPESEYYKKPDNKSVLIKISIAAYHAGFGTDISGGIGMVGGHFSTMVFPKGQWNAITSYYVQAFVAGKSTTKEISNVSSKSNMFGYKSAKSALNECYNKSTGELLFFIDEQLSNF